MEGIIGQIAGAARAWLNRKLVKRGFAIGSIRPEWIRGSPEHLHHSFSFRTLRRPVVVEIPPYRLRGLYWYRMTPGEHPLVSSLMAARSGNRAYAGSPLEEFYTHCQPTTAAELVGLGSESVLGDLPPASAVFPWFDILPEQRLVHRNHVERTEAAAFGVILEHPAGSKLFGPVSPEKGSLELRRAARVLESIDRHGYKRRDSPDGDIGATLLIDGDAWCLQIWQGHHRAAAAAAAGLETVPVRIAESPVRRDDVNQWYQVRNGTMTQEEAIAIFDRVMHGSPPPAMRWPRPK